MLNLTERGLNVSIFVIIVASMCDIYVICRTWLLHNNKISLF